MKTQILRGSKEQIAEAVIRIGGEVREAIVFVEEPLDLTEDLGGQDVLAEMEPLMVKGDNVDYSRESFGVSGD